MSASFRFVVPAGTDWGALRNLMKERANHFHRLPGLRSKAFLLDMERREIGGNYVWETRGLRRRCGSETEIARGPACNTMLAAH